MASVVLINPNLVFQASDPFTTGIVYMPVGLAHFAGALKAAGHTPRVIDAFGQAPNNWFADKGLVFRGLPPEDVAARLPADAQVAFVYALHLTFHRSVIMIIQEIKRRRPDLKVAVMENTQAVTAYSLRQVMDEFFEAGADAVMTGEPEERGERLVTAWAQKSPASTIAGIDGIGIRTKGQTLYTPPGAPIPDLDALPFPEWELFPLENYWRLRYAHGPLTTRRYLPMLTSRGCPYPCGFCVIPETNNRKWRARGSKNVADEMQMWKDRLGVTEFHIEDVDPTVNDDRTRAICQEMIDRKINVTWKICSGTKVETMKSEETVELMAKAGCRYISISPESGSPRVLKLINKPFNIEHARKLIRKMNDVGIRSQACFVLGYPGEESEDRLMTLQLARDLTRGGVDEIAVFIVTPVPGSSIFKQFGGYTDYSQLTFSPAWRNDYDMLNRFRIRLYRTFLLNKMFFHPWKFMAQPFHFLRRRFHTKMEMAPYRALHSLLIRRQPSGRPAVAGSGA